MSNSCPLRRARKEITESIDRNTCAAYSSFGGAATWASLRDLLRLSGQSGRKCSGIDRITENHLKEIEAKIADLRRLAAQLRRIKNGCPGKGRIADCRVLAALSPSA
jgi:MerR, DNA binding